MKTLAMTVIFAMTVMINAIGGNIQNNFAYNTVMNGGQVESKMVYKVEDGKYLQQHLQYNFKYDANNRILQKEVLKWNEIERAFERNYCLNYNYTEASTDVEYALWDSKTNAYSDVKEKAVYLYEPGGVNYLSYQWNKKENDWNLLVEHPIDGDNVQLLADK